MAQLGIFWNWHTNKSLYKGHSQCQIISTKIEKGEHYLLGSSIPVQPPKLQCIHPKCTHTNSIHILPMSHPIDMGSHSLGIMLFFQTGY